MNSIQNRAKPMFKRALILVNTESEPGSRGNRTPWKRLERLLAHKLTPELQSVNNTRGTKGGLCVLSFRFTSSEQHLGAMRQPRRLSASMKVIVNIDSVHLPDSTRDPIRSGRPYFSPTSSHLTVYSNSSVSSSSGFGSWAAAQTGLGAHSSSLAPPPSQHASH